MSDPSVRYDKYSSADQVLRMVLAHFDKDGYRLCSEEFLCLVIQEARGALAALPESGLSDENIRVLAQKHARNAVAPIGAMPIPGADIALAREIHRAQEVIYYAIKDALSWQPVAPVSATRTIPSVAIRAIKSLPGGRFVIEYGDGNKAEFHTFRDMADYIAEGDQARWAAIDRADAVSTRQPTEQAVIDTAMAWFRKMQQQGMTHEDYEGESLDAWAACEAHDLALSAIQPRDDSAPLSTTKHA